jgi:hypothetical protein
MARGPQWLWWLGDWARVSPFLKRAAVTTRGGSCVLLLLPQFSCFVLHWRLFYYLVHRRKHPRGLLVVSEGGLRFYPVVYSLPCSPRAATSASGTAAYFFLTLPAPCLVCLVRFHEMYFTEATRFIQYPHSVAALLLLLGIAHCLVSTY